jgi:hypothetical protein
MLEVDVELLDLSYMDPKAAAMLVAQLLQPILPPRTHAHPAHPVPPHGAPTCALET